MAKFVFGASLITTLALVAVMPVLAAVNVSAEGQVTAIDTVAGNFTLQSDADVYTVIPPAGFDLTTLVVGDQVAVEGSLDAGVITATSVEIIPAGVFVEEYGYVTAISDTGFEFENLDGNTRSVVPTADFDLSTLAVGDFICAHGTLVDNTITAEELAILESIEVTGQVTALGGEDSVAFTMQSGDSEYAIIPVGDIDLAGLKVGDQVSVTGFLFEDEEGLEIFATMIEILPTKGGAPNQGNFCTNPDAQHPALSALAAVYGADYGQLLNYFCIGHYGIGEIGLALQTAALANNGMTAGDILALKTQLGGWGQVWMQLALKGNK